MPGSLIERVALRDEAIAITVSAPALLALSGVVCATAFVLAVNESGA